MCGIAGWIDWKKDLTLEGDVLESMREVLAHRGPDDSGSWISPTAALLHRRLTVIDPEGGRQPMVRQRGGDSCVIVYNGELYNTEELRRELVSRGHRFKSYSDTEVLLVSYLEWGEHCVERLNGIFAFAVWDEERRSLFMARDFLGVKPLFYTQRGSGFLFGSELKALLANPLVAPEIDAQGLAEVFVMGPARTPGLGVFRGVHELRPGWCLTHDSRGSRTRQFWRLESYPHPDSLEKTTGRVRELIQDAVERQLVADVPVCALLSGGLDSSAITAFASLEFRRGGQGTLRTFSVDYVDNSRYFRPNQFQPNSDTVYIDQMTRGFDTSHKNIVFDTPELVESLGTALRSRDLPGMVDIDSSLYLFCREIKREATVALSGESADEVFGGYPWFFRPEDVSSDTFPWIRMVSERAGLLSPDLVGMIRPEQYVRKRYLEALEEVPRLPGEDPGEARMREMLYLNLTRFMPILLDRKDRMSMAVGLEVRVPFCDHRLVQYVWNIPWSMKTVDQREKGIMRRALRDTLPQEIVERRKSPYPKTHNPSYLKAVQDQMQEVLDDPSSPLLPLIDQRAVREVVRSGAAGFDPAWFSQLLGGAQYLAYLLQVDTWLREYRVRIV
ncbi:MAG: asparagine synthase (glutamine-hydrolyzing) [Firmicutes bacterium]|nr:asparagine synthase (glutamine-hydrolyzing) [Bacillota bacterium]